MWNFEGFLIIINIYYIFLYFIIFLVFFHLDCAVAYSVGNSFGLQSGSSWTETLEI